MCAVLQGKTSAILTSYGNEGMDVRGRVVGFNYEVATEVLNLAVRWCGKDLPRRGAIGTKFCKGEKWHDQKTEVAYMWPEMGNNRREREREGEDEEKKWEKRRGES